MCGIVGALNFGNSSYKITEDYIIGMRDTLIHRGPDGAGVWVSKDQEIGLGHRRLSIIDLSEAATQPMCNADGTLWITYNGEVYNHAEIRTELQQLGRRKWKTDHSDTEVVLQAFEEWGIDCLEKFRGMFAFALWDTKAQALWLVRDRIGIKPLYYSIHHGRLTFASEIKALLKDTEQPRDVNEEAFFHYLSFLTTPAPSTFFEGISKLPAGMWMRVQADGQIREHKYWDVWDHTNPILNCSDDEIAERIKDELQRSVALRKVSDVPVGVFLSGGIDSSTNAAMFSEGENNAIKTFCIGYEGENASCPNETDHAKMMADIIGATHFERILSVDDLMPFLPRMVELQDEPLGDPVNFPLYFVSELARREGVIVCQVGEGADELFWGYPNWKRSLNLQKLNDWKLPKFLKQAGLFGLDALGGGQTPHYEWLQRGTRGLPIFWGGTDAIPEAQKYSLMSERMQNKFKSLSSWQALEPHYERFQKNAWEKSPLNWMSYIDLNLRLPELMLARVDKMSMGVSLECRVPFLDHKFVELAMSIPQDVKTRHGNLKYILKHAVRDVIPKELIERKKQGFFVPIFDWKQDAYTEKIREELDLFLSQTDYFNKKKVFELIDNGESAKVWYLFNIALWWNAYIGGKR